MTQRRNTTRVEISKKSIVRMRYSLPGYLPIKKLKLLECALSLNFVAGLLVKGVFL